MLKARYYQTDGAAGGEQNLPEWLFDGVVNEDVLHQVIKAYLSNQRQGTAAAKSRGQVAGGSHKPWRQKGTGRARQGTIRAAQWAGGGRAFPPIPHSWRQRVPKKVRALARRSAFNTRAQGERVILVDSFDFESPKTKLLVQFLAAVGAEDKVLVLTHEANDNLYLSARNLSHVLVRPFGEASAYEILWANVLVIEKVALDNAEPSEADREAIASKVRGEPEVRVRQRAAVEEQAERKKARMGHAKKKAEAAPSKATKAAPSKATKAAPSQATPVAPAEAKTEEEPKVEEALKAAPAVEAESGVDVSSVKLPNVGELAEFLTQFDAAADVEALKARDNRKTAVAHYDSRLAELAGGDSREGDDDA